MRELFSAFLIGMTIALILCIVLAKRSRKSISGAVAFLLSAIIPPIVGNTIIVASGNEIVATIGCYIYYMGMDLFMYAMLRFAFKYCSISWSNKSNKYIRGFVHSILIIDIIQFLLNPFFGHAFETEKIIVDDFPYYSMIPHLGQTYHRIVCYGIFLAVIIIYIVMLVRTPRIYSEKYSIILLSLVVGGLWQTAYIFSRTPVDRSMIGFAIFGFLVFYFSIYYRPMRLLDRMLAGIASDMPESLYFFDLSGRCIWVNEPGKNLIDINSKQFDKVSEKLNDLFGDIDTEQPEWSLKKVLGSGNNVRFYSIDKRNVENDNSRVVGSLISVRDNTEEQKNLQMELFNANHDTLTGLYTKEYLYKSFERKINRNLDIAFLAGYVDVKNFKIVNDIFGNDFGDYAIKCIADLVSSFVPKEGICGRLAGDTFGFVMPVNKFDKDSVNKKLSDFVVSNGKVEHRIMINIGIYEVNEKGLDVSVIFDRAHLALSMAGNEFQSGIVYYDDKMREMMLWEQMISTQLPKALEEKRIVPYLQPLVDTSGKIVGAEALVRWMHPEHGYLSPGRFIPVFEKNGMIVDVDRYMWRCACEIISQWKDINKDIFISINISPKDFYFMNVPEELNKLVKEFQIDIKRLRLEITETVMMTDADSRMQILNKLREDGFIVEMDDFGSGYSSLNLLKDMPVDLLKIDMMFLKASENDIKAQKIVQNIIHLTTDLGIESLTEGVETETQYQMLSEMGCKLFQGYYFSKPIPVDEFERSYL